MTSRTVIKAAFATVLLWQPLQIEWISMFGEPYPAITMPSFKYAGPRDGEALTSEQVDTLVHFDHGDSLVLSPNLLLAQLPSGQQDAIYSYFTDQLLPAPAAQPVTGKSWKARLKAFYVNHVASRREKLAVSSADQNIRWIAGRVGELFPDRHVSGISLQWYTETYHIEHGGVSVSRERTHEFTIDTAAGR